MGILENKNRTFETFLGVTCIPFFVDQKLREAAFPY